MPSLRARCSAILATAATAALLLAVHPAGAAGPQPDPPAFGMFGITGIQRAHLHLARPAINTARGGGRRVPGPCTVDVSFVNEDGKAVFMETHTIAPGTTGRAIFDPRPGGDQVPTLAADVGPTRQQLRAVIVPVGDGKDVDECAALVATVQVDNGGGVPTLTVSPVLSPRDAASGLPTGKRQHKPFTILSGPLAIGFGHTARLNIVNGGTGNDIHCVLDWTFVDETGARTGGKAEIRGGQAVHADFAHTDPNRGLAAIRGEVTVTEGDTGSCPSDPGPIVTLEGFDSAQGHSHSIVPAQLFLPAVQ